MNKKNNKLAQLRELQKNDDKSLQDIMDKALQIFNNPLVLYDSEARIIAYPKAIANSPLWSKYFRDGMIHPDILKKGINAGFSDVLARPDKVVALKGNLKSNETTHISGKVYDPDGFVIAVLTINRMYQPFEDIDFKIVDSICKMLPKEIYKLPYYQNYPYKLLDKYIKKLIESDIESEKSTFAINIIEMFYMRFKGNMYFAVADISQCDPTYAKLEYYRNLFREIRPAFKYFAYSNHIVFIMSTDEPVLYPRKILNRLNKLLEQENISIGISSRFENIFELSKYYSEAVIALQTGLEGSNRQRIFLYA